MASLEPMTTMETTESTMSNNRTIQPLDIEAAQAPARTKLRIAAILVALYLSLFVVALDQTIIATSIPVITADLGTSSGYFWIGGAFLLADAAAAPIWSKGSDIWGRKPVLLVNLVIFAVGSALAATSQTMRVLVAARALQGVACGGLSQLVVITISDLFSVRKRALYFGFVEVTWAVAGGVGPIVGGALTQLVSWRWCFWLNLPVAGLTFVLLVLFLNVHNPRTPLRSGFLAIDWFGTVSILGVVLMLLLGLDFGGVTFPWNSPTVICLIVLGTVMIGVFVFSELRLARYPLIPTGVFSQTTPLAALAVVFCQGMVFLGAQFYLPLFFQAVKSASPLQSGIYLAPIVAAEAVMGVFSAVTIHATGRYRETMWAGTLLMTVGVALFITFKHSTPIGQIIGLAIIGGLGTGLLFQPPIVAVQAFVSQRDTATATSTLGFARAMSAAFSIVIGGVIFQNGMETRVSSLRAAGLSEKLVAAFSDGNAAASIEVIPTIRNVTQRNAVQAAYAWSLRNVWIAYSAIAGIGLVASFFIQHRDLSMEHTETRTGIDEMTDRKVAVMET